METLHVASVRRQAGKAGVKDQASHAKSSQRRQQRRDAAEAAVEGRVAWKAFERFGRLAVEEDHACNLFGIPAREDPDVLRTGRMADEHERTWNAARVPTTRGGPSPRPYRPVERGPNRSNRGPRGRTRTLSFRVRAPSKSIPNRRPSRPTLIRERRWECRSRRSADEAGVRRHQPTGRAPDTCGGRATLGWSDSRLRRRKARTALNSGYTTQDRCDCADPGERGSTVPARSARKSGGQTHPSASMTDAARREDEKSGAGQRHEAGERRPPIAVAARSTASTASPARPNSPRT